MSKEPLPPVSPERSPATAPQVVSEDPLLIGREHIMGASAGTPEVSRIWHHSALRGAELFYGAYRQFEFARHYHSAAAIGVVERGIMESFVLGTDYISPAGTVILLNPGDVHAPHSTDDLGWSFRIFFLEESLLRQKLPPLGKDAVRFQAPYVQDAHAAAQLLHLHRQMEAQGLTLELESSLTDVLLQLTQHHARLSPPDADPKEEPAKIRRAREFIDAYCLREISLEKLAEIAGLSEYHLVHAFTRVVGLPPHAYQMQRRIEAAKRLLRRGEPIASVAFATGFVDQTHFSRNFKRILGVTPGHYYSRPQKRTS